MMGHSGGNQSCLFDSFNLDDHVPSDHLLRDIDRFLDNRDLHVARSIAKTHLYRQSRKDRQKVEMLFAHLKRIVNLTRLRLRGMSGAQDEFLVAAIAQNLR
jgi:Transposase DDE domain